MHRLFRRDRADSWLFVPRRVGLISSVILAVTIGAYLSEDSGRAVHRTLLRVTTVSDAVPANAQPDVKYIGSQACIECHQDQHESYLQTTHSVATEKTDGAKEPAATSFRHKHTGHLYEADHRDGDLLHREIMRDALGAERHRTEVEITHSIGSGAHGKSYLYRDGDFWAQSPLSWFKETKDWGMSPGFESPMHISFRRGVGTGCVFCHVGHIDRKAGNPYDFDIVETTIGCERCHGPGELHAKKHRGNLQAAVAAEPDDTIVNPVRLSRELSEAVCQQCHLQAAAKSPVSGKVEWDYRPGLPLTDFRIDYQYQLGDDTMKIVGHVEQMHQSECYKQTETLTCVTCHNPHQTVEPEQRIEHFRSVCLSCHQDQACRKPHAERIELADNNCAQCHMPKQDTDVVHAAFHHHRIGIHDEKAKNAREIIAGLSPVLDVSELSEQERQRGAALAKVQVFREQPGNPSFKGYPVEATEELVKLMNAGVSDPELNAVLAWLARQQGQARIANLLARLVRKQDPAPTRNRSEATRQLAMDAFQKRDFKTAVDLFREVVTMRRDPTDSYYLGICENNAGNAEAAIAALKRSLEIDPSQEAAHVALAAILQAEGKLQESEYHAREADANRQHAEQMMEKQRELAEQEPGPGR